MSERVRIVVYDWVKRYPFGVGGMLTALSLQPVRTFWIGGARLVVAKHRHGERSARKRWAR